MPYLLFGLSALAGLIGTWRGSQGKRAQAWVARVITLILLATLGVQIQEERTKEAREWRAQTQGILRGPRLSSQKRPVIVVGLSKLIWNGNPGEPIFVNPEKAEGVVFVKMVDGEARVSTIVRDEKANVLAELRENAWFVPFSESSDRNFSDRALEVVDSDRKPILQVEIDGEEVRIAARWDGPGGYRVEPWLHEIDGRDGSLFRYPSVDHRGELSPVIHPK